MHGVQLADDDLELDEDLHRLQHSDGRAILEDFVRTTGGLPPYAGEFLPWSVC